MSIVPLSCPKCGGSLEVDEFAMRAKCPFCGTEHVVQQDGSGEVALEFHARCPRCKRNDQVKSLTAIYREGSHLAHNLAPPNKPALSSRKAAPKGSNYTIEKYLSELSLISILALISIGVFLLVAMPVMKLMGLVVLIACVAAANTARKKRARWKDCDYELADIRVFNENVDRANYILMKRWETESGMWRRLYYCGRDDSVFLPGQERTTSPGQLSKFIKALVEDAGPPKSEV